MQIFTIFMNFVKILTSTKSFKYFRLWIDEFKQNKIDFVDNWVRIPVLFSIYILFFLLYWKVQEFLLLVLKNIKKYNFLPETILSLSNLLPKKLMTDGWLYHNHTNYYKIDTFWVIKIYCDIKINHFTFLILKLI